MKVDKVMKKGFLACLLILSPLLLSACSEEGGFSVDDFDDFQPHNVDTDPDKEKPDDSDYSGGGGSGGNEQKENPEQDKTDENPDTPINPKPEEPADVDLGIKIVTFKASIISIDEDYYVSVKFEKDPFVNNYDFSYYTVNEKRLDKSEFIEKESDDSNYTYKLFLGSNDNLVYVIKYYNSESKQYGVTELKQKASVKTENSSYFIKAFDILRVKIYSIGHNIQTHFKKIENFFKGLFDPDHISL